MAADPTPAGAVEAVERTDVQVFTPLGRDRICLRGVAARGHHGVLDVERQQGQRFVVDVVCSLDLTVSGATDALAATVNYADLAEAIVADIEGSPLNLIEALAERIASTCLADSLVQAVEVTVHKPEAPISVEFADVAVTLTRSRT